MKVIVAVGGTGGHLYPGVALAQELRRLDPAGEIIFVGAQKKMTEQILARAIEHSHALARAKAQHQLGQVARAILSPRLRVEGAQVIHGANLRAEFEPLADIFTVLL